MNEIRTKAFCRTSFVTIFNSNCFYFQVSLHSSGAVGQGAAVSWNREIHGNADDRWGDKCVSCFLRSCMVPSTSPLFSFMEALCINSQFSRNSQISDVKEHFTAWNATWSFYCSRLAISQPIFSLGLEPLYVAASMVLVWVVVMVEIVETVV